MIKLDELPEELVNWYCGEIKPKVEKRIEECKEIFKEKSENINNKKILEELEKIQKNLDKFLKSDDLKSLISNNKGYICNLQEIIKEKNIFTYIFDYEMLKSEKNQVTLRHRILSKMGVKTCPYCDRQYITNYNESSSTADLDHFYSQSKYPYLALNIYNFIPSCAVCNRNFKKNKEIKINPQVEEFGENGIFRLKNVVDNIMDIELKDIKIDIISKGDRKKDIETNIEIFKLREVYKIHNDYVLQMIKDITFRGNESYLESFKEFFRENNNSDINLLTEERIIPILKEMILKPYKFKIDSKEPLGKLTKDILDDIEKNYK